MKDKYLSTLRYAPYKTTDGRWRTYVYKIIDGREKRISITKSKIEDLEKAVIKFYKEIDNPFTSGQITNLENLFPFYMEEMAKDGTNNGTMHHDECDWERYLKKDSFVKESFKEITLSSFTKWFKRKLKSGLYNEKNGKTEDYTVKQAKTLRSLLNKLFQFALEYDLVEKNFSRELGNFSYVKFCSNDTKVDSEQVYQDDEPTKIMTLALSKFNETHNYAYLAIILNFQLGLRVGELVALKFSDLDNKPGFIHIQREEVINYEINPTTGKRCRNGKKIVPHTKTFVNRYLEVSPTTTKIINTIREDFVKRGIESEYIFVNSNGERMHDDSVNGVLNKVLNPGIGTSQKSCHNIRKTVISQVREKFGLIAAARVAGHTNLSTTDKYYSFSIRSEEKNPYKYYDALENNIPASLKAI